MRSGMILTACAALVPLYLGSPQSADATPSTILGVYRETATSGSGGCGGSNLTTTCLLSFSPLKQGIIVTSVSCQFDVFVTNQGDPTGTSFRLGETSVAGKFRGTGEFLPLPLPQALGSFFGAPILEYELSTSTLQPYVRGKQPAIQLTYSPASASSIACSITGEPQAGQ